jgi:hypothetical protein
MSLVELLEKIDQNEIDYDNIPDEFEVELSRALDDDLIYSDVDGFELTPAGRDYLSRHGNQETDNQDSEEGQELQENEDQDTGRNILSYIPKAAVIFLLFCLLAAFVIYMDLGSVSERDISLSLSSEGVSSASHIGVRYRYPERYPVKALGYYNWPEEQNESLRDMNFVEDKGLTKYTIIFEDIKLEDNSTYVKMNLRSPTGGKIDTEVDEITQGICHRFENVSDEGFRIEKIESSQDTICGKITLKYIISPNQYPKGVYSFDAVELSPRTITMQFVADDEYFVCPDGCITPTTIGTRVDDFTRYKDTSLDNLEDSKNAKAVVRNGRFVNADLDYSIGEDVQQAREGLMAMLAILGIVGLVPIYSILDNRF